MTILQEAPQKFRQDENGWTWYPLEYILQNAKFSIDFGYDFDWEIVFWEKTAHTGFMHLVHSIQEHGWLSAIGWNDSSKEITEGHHRICAAILLCEDEIPTTTMGTNAYRNNDRYDRLVWTDDSEDPQPFVA